MEKHKHLEPHFSYSFEELNEILLSNFKESSSVANSSAIGSQISVQNNQGFSNNLKDRAFEIDSNNV